MTPDRPRVLTPEERLNLATRAATVAAEKHKPKKPVPPGAFEAVKLLLIQTFCDDALGGDVGGFWMETEKNAMDPERACFHFFRGGYTHIEVADLIMAADPRTHKEILGDGYVIYRDQLAGTILEYFPQEYKTPDVA